MNPSDLETRILTLLDGELPPGEASELESFLLHNKEARETYQNLVMIHNALESRFAAEPAASQMAVVPMDRLIAAQQRQLAHRALLAAAAVLVISLVTMWLILAPKQATTLGPIRTTPDALLAMSYEGRGKRPEGGKLTVGTRLRLSKGMMEGIFENGVRLLAEAPCDLLVIDEDQVSLSSGTSWFHVPPAAVGFTVSTPELEIIDLSTEFGVTSPLAGSDEVHVIKGQVEVSLRRRSGGGQILAAGAAVEVGTDGKLREIQPNESLFKTELVKSREIAIVNHSFEADVIPRDGNRAPRNSEGDDYQKNLVPSGWLAFQDGRGNSSQGCGVASTAKDSFFGGILAATPDADANDQAFFSAGSDVYQTLPETLRPNVPYVLSVDVGDWRSGNYYDGNPGKPDFRLGTGDRPGENLLEPSDTDFPEQVDGQWVRRTATYRTGPDPEGLGQPLRVELLGSGHMSWFDDVRLMVEAVSDAKN